MIFDSAGKTSAQTFNSKHDLEFLRRCLKAPFDYTTPAGDGGFLVPFFENCIFLDEKAEEGAGSWERRRRWDLNPHAPKGRRVSCQQLPKLLFSNFESKEEDLERGERPDCSTPAVFEICLCSAIKRYLG